MTDLGVPNALLKRRSTHLRWRYCAHFFMASKSGNTLCLHEYNGNKSLTHSHEFTWITCSTLLLRPVFWASCFRSLVSGLWLREKYDFIVRNWWCLNDVRMRFCLPVICCSWYMSCFIWSPSCCPTPARTVAVMVYPHRLFCCLHLTAN